MKKMFMAVIVLMMTISSSAQFYVYYSNGTVAKVDSISIVAPSQGNTNQEDIQEPVDLGLSVKWATCNVGASKPEELSDKFAWGEVSPKDSYTEENYKWIHIWWDENEDGSCPIPGSHSHRDFTKYYGNVDNKTILEKEDDAASVNWGGEWRMPTWEETKELLNNCVWKMTTQNGVSGFKVTGTNGNSIFLPADFLSGQDGYSYWTNTVDYKYNNFKYAIMLFLDDENGIAYWEIGGREVGKMVRAVCP